MLKTLREEKRSVAHCSVDNTTINTHLCTCNFLFTQSNISVYRGESKERRRVSLVFTYMMIYIPLFTYCKEERKRLKKHTKKNETERRTEFSVYSWSLYPIIFLIYSTMSIYSYSFSLSSSSFFNLVNFVGCSEGGLVLPC